MMEFKHPGNKDHEPKADLTDVTILGTPRPQASSTVERKATLGNWAHDVPMQDTNRYKRPILNDSDIQKTADSSLGILNNISSLLGDSGVIEGKQSSKSVNKIDTERELARQLLQRCSEPRKSSSFLEPDKENNSNLQNLMSDSTPSTLIDSGQQTLLNNSGSFRGSLLQTPTNKSGTTQVIFEPNEISARSSGLSNSLNKCASSNSPPTSGGISFDTTAAAELMAQFADEDFQSGSRVGSRMLADELSWQQNCSYAMPTNMSNGGEREHLELSCFSGIIGDLDLSVESHAGRKVSVGEFFQRKCGNIGQLQESETMNRPSFGESIRSPTKHGQMVPLVDETIMTEASSVIRESDKKQMLETTEFAKQTSMMSLSCIAQALNDIENGTPRRLVDQLIMAKKRNKVQQPHSVKAIGETYDVLPSGRSSMVSTSSLAANDKPEKDISIRAAQSFHQQPARYSLDSKITQDTPGSKLKLSRMSLNSALDDVISKKLNGSYTGILEEQLNRNQEASQKDTGKDTGGIKKPTGSLSMQHTNITRNLLSSMDDSELSHTINENSPIGQQMQDSLHYLTTAPKSNATSQTMKDSKVSQDTSPSLKTLTQVNPPSIQNLMQNFDALTLGEKSLISQGTILNRQSIEQIQVSLLEDARMMDMQDSGVHHSTKLESSVNTDMSRYQTKTRQSENVILARNAQELFICIVGVSREVEIEILNRGDRWMMCSLSLYQIQGDKECIELDLPVDRVLVEPDAWKSVKMGVKVSRMGKPIIAVLTIAMSDMVTRSNGMIKHLMCFVPEEPQVSVLTHSGKEEMNFQCIAEKCSKTLPVTLENKNNVELPIKLCILQEHNRPKLFSIDSLTDESMNTSDTCNGTRHLILKPRQQFTVNIQFKGAPLDSLNVDKGLFNAAANLVIQLYTDEDDGSVVKEVPLSGCIGASKIDLVDTRLPVIIPRKQSKPLNLINSGDIAVLLSASVIESNKSNNSVKDFFVKPDNLFLQAGERGAILVYYKPQGSESSERNVTIKVTAGGSEYYYSVVGESEYPIDHQSNNVQRCDTPQHVPGQMSSPNSPHSSSSNRSGNSGRHSPGSATSGSTVAGDVIPIQSTHAALVWSSIKAGKSDIKEFTIRNKSNNKIKLHACIVDNNKSFKFLKDRQTVGSSIVLVLQPMESRTLSVVFGPNNPGASAGRIVFAHHSSRKEQEESRATRVIFLYGYGGIGKVEITEAFKDIAGQMWLSLGQLNSGGTLTAKIKLQNTGDLCAYAKIKLTPKALYPAMVSSWHVDPVELLLGPDEVQWVKLEFHPRREDLALLRRADVSHVGTLTITHGDEPTRWRIRRLYNKLKETDQFNGAENEMFRNIVYPICKVFPGEALVQDLRIIRDSVQYLGDLCRGVSQHEVMLTMEVNADETMANFVDNVDDTRMFYSLCSDSSSMFAGGCESFMPSEAFMENHRNDHGRVYEDDFTVNPAIVTLAPPFRYEAMVTVSSLCNVAQPFETIISDSNYLRVVPTEGMIPAGRSFPLKVQCSKEINRNLEGVLQIFIENDKREVLIRISCNNRK